MLKPIITLALLLAVLSVDTISRENGITGVYQNGCGGKGCHGEGTTAATAVQLIGPTTVRAGATANYTFKVAHAQQDAGGLNIAFLPAVGAPVGTLTAGAGSRVGSNQLTHSEPKDFDGGAASFDFTWEAPAAHGNYDFKGAGNAVDDNGNSDGDLWNTMTQRIVVTGANATSPSNGQSFCQGGSLPVRWNQTGFTTFRIEMSSDGFNTIFNIANTADATTGTLDYMIPVDQAPANSYVVRLMDTRTGDEIARSGVFTISDGPIITQSPADVTVCDGRTATLLIGATGKDIVYQWRKDGAIVAGATTPQLRIINAKLADEGSYDCVVTACGIEVISGAAQVTVEISPRVVTQPVAASVCEGERVEFSTDATGTKVTYQWLKNGVPISGADSRLLIFAGAALVDDAEYTCRISGSCPPQITTDTVRLQIVKPPSITNHPEGTELKVGESLVLSATAEGDNLEYVWFKDGSIVAGETESSLSIQSVSLSDAGDYSVQVKNRCDSAISDMATVVVKPADGPGILALASDTVDLGEHPTCSSADTVVMNQLLNQGGLPIVVTAIELSPSSGFSVNAPSLPVTIDAGGAIDIELEATEIVLGSSSAVVAVSTESSSVEMTVLVEGTSIMSAMPDTLVYGAGVTGESHCLSTTSNDCPETIFSSITVTGDGSDNYEIVDAPTLPVSVSAGASLDLCVRSTDTSSSAATVVIESDAGTTEIVLVRKVISSVEEEVNSEIMGLTIAPNPMKDEVRIASPANYPMNAKIYTVLGSQVAELSGIGEIIWDGRDTAGARLNQGLYVVRIEQRGSVSVVKLLLEQ